MYHKASFDSGHIIHALHIEKPERRFVVEWQSSGLRVPLHDGWGIEYETGTRWCYVLAETEGGALNIAAYHYFKTGRLFKIRKPPRTDP